jgi:hypothetical protein
VKRHILQRRFETAPRSCVRGFQTIDG